VATYSAQQTQWALTETSLPSHTPEPTSTATQTPTITQTSWTITYPVKQVLFRFAPGVGYFTVYGDVFQSFHYY
jgi:hypothetical protein